MLALVVGFAAMSHAQGPPVPPAAYPPSVPMTTTRFAEPETAPQYVEQPYFDLDAYLEESPHAGHGGSGFYFQILPNNLIYKSYLAGVKEPRLGAQVSYARNDGWLWDPVLGGRIGLLRWGDNAQMFPQGIQVDAEGAAIVRLDISDEVDVRAADYRGGVPVTFGYGRHQTKLAYFHMSSHLGDEYIIKNPTFPRLNWSRDAFVLGQSYYVTDTLRLYGEVGWAFYSEISEPWEFQFGLDWAPNSPTGFRGAPFFAINGHLRQELNYSGNMTLQTGWAWMSDRDRHLLRLGFHYFNGKSSQYSMYDSFEHLIGFGLWYDF
jgi:hypothetical protein